MTGDWARTTTSSTEPTDYVEPTNYIDISVTWLYSYVSIPTLTDDFGDFNQRVKKQSNIDWMRSQWEFAEYLLWLPKYVLSNANIFARKMNLSYSGWLARKGYKKRRGK